VRGGKRPEAGALRIASRLRRRCKIILDTPTLERDGRNSADNVVVVRFHLILTKGLLQEEKLKGIFTLSTGMSDILEDEVMGWLEKTTLSKRRGGTKEDTTGFQSTSNKTW